MVVRPPLEILEEGALIGHAVAYNVFRLNAEAILQPANEGQPGLYLGRSVQDLARRPSVSGAGILNELYADRDVVEPDRVAAAQVKRDELLDGAIFVDDEVGDCAGLLPNVRLV